MFRVSRLIVVLAVVGAVWFFWPFGKYEDAVSVAPPSDSEQRELFTRPLSKTATSPQTKPSPDTVRQDVAVATPDATTQKDDPGESALRPKRFYRVVVQDGGSLKSGATTITLAGIDVEALSGQCEDSRGEAWPCGRAARSALMRLIRGRAVTCHVPTSEVPQTLAASCSVGGKDLSFWMVSQGWARPTQPAQAAFKEAEDAARERRLGIWR